MTAAQEDFRDLRAGVTRRVKEWSSRTDVSRNKGVEQRAGSKWWERERNCANRVVMEKLSDHLVDGFKGGQGIVRERDLGNREESSALPSDRSFWISCVSENVPRTRKFAGRSSNRLLLWLSLLKRVTQAKNKSKGGTSAEKLSRQRAATKKGKERWTLHMYTT